MNVPLLSRESPVTASTGSRGVAQVEQPMLQAESRALGKVSKAWVSGYA